MKRRRKPLEVSTFPFLAVLLCTMGALILVLLAIDRRARAVALAREVQRLGRLEAEDEAVVRAREAEWERRRQALHEALAEQLADAASKSKELTKKKADAEATLAAIEARFRELHKRTTDGKVDADKVRKALASKKAESAAAEKQSAEMRARLALMANDLDHLEQALADLKKARERQNQTYSLVPYRGKHGDSRRPLYIECTATGVIFHPDHKAMEGPLVTRSDIREEVSHRIEAQRAALRGAGETAPAKPYILMLVRPSGIDHYYRTMLSLSGLEIEYGYEMIEEDWALDFPADDDRPATKAWASANIPATTAPVPHTDQGPLPSASSNNWMGSHGPGGTGGDAILGQRPGGPPVRGVRQDTVAMVGGPGGPSGTGMGPGGTAASNGPGVENSGATGAGGPRGPPGFPGNGPIRGYAIGKGSGRGGINGVGDPSGSGNGPGGPIAMGPPSPLAGGADWLGTGGGTGTGSGTGGSGPGGPGTGNGTGTGPGGTGNGNGPGGTGTGNGVAGGVPGGNGTAGGSGNGTGSGNGVGKLGNGTGTGNGNGPGGTGTGNGTGSGNGGSATGTGSGPGGKGQPGGTGNGLGGTAKGSGAGNGGATGAGNGSGTGNGVAGGLGNGGKPGTGNGNGPGGNGTGNDAPVRDPFALPATGGIGTGTGTGNGTGQGGANGTPGNGSAAGNGVAAQGGGNGAGGNGASGTGNGSGNNGGPPGGQGGDGSGNGASPGTSFAITRYTPPSNGTGTGGSGPGGQPGTGQSGSGQPRTGGQVSAGGQPGSGRPAQANGAAGQPGDPTDPNEPSPTAGDVPMPETRNDGQGGGNGPSSKALAKISRGGPGMPDRSPSRPPIRLGPNRDWVINIECTADSVLVPAAGTSLKLSALEAAGSGSNNPLYQTVRSMIEQRQATVRPGDDPYQPQIRFRVKPDGLRAYYASYPALISLQLPMSKETVEPPVHIRTEEIRQ